MAAWYRRLVWFATALALFVIVLGAAVRLNDAGLGCPDWPGCYGDFFPATVDAAEAVEAYPERPFEAIKAWYEMVHRYVASTLGFSILLIAWCAWKNRDDPNQPVKVPLALVAVVIFQGLLGMWTVTLLLKPVIVMGHLIGGLSTLGLLFWLALEDLRGPGPQKQIFWPALVGLVVLSCQIALGGWTSSNYAALACPDLPTCLGQWWPEQADFAEGFVMWRGLGVDYEFGILEAPARVAIHFAHRLGAVVATLLLIAVTLISMRRLPTNDAVRTASYLVWLALVTQVTLGICTVWFGLPLAVATAHNGVAALLLLAVINLNHVTSRTA
jgi:cytochrome c oxidase assembly protein subunit 15